jgi:hypothetical protein
MILENIMDIIMQKTDKVSTCRDSCKLIGCSGRIVESHLVRSQTLQLLLQATDPQSSDSQTLRHITADAGNTDY